MLDKFLKFGSTFDWITPLWAFFQDARNGNPLQVNVPYDASWSGGQIQLLLEDKGVQVWGLMVVDDTITFTISETQAKYAKYWLDQWGVPYQGPLHTFEGSRSQKQSMNERSDHPTPTHQGWIERSIHGILKFTSEL